MKRTRPMNWDCFANTFKNQNTSVPKKRTSSLYQHGSLRRSISVIFGHRNFCECHPHNTKDEPWSRFLLCEQVYRCTFLCCIVYVVNKHYDTYWKWFRGTFHWTFTCNLRFYECCTCEMFPVSLSYIGPENVRLFWWTDQGISGLPGCLLLRNASCVWFSCCAL